MILIDILSHKKKIHKNRIGRNAIDRRGSSPGLDWGGHTHTHAQGTKLRPLSRAWKPRWAALGSQRDDTLRQVYAATHLICLQLLCFERMSVLFFSFSDLYWNVGHFPNARFSLPREYFSRVAHFLRHCWKSIFFVFEVNEWKDIWFRFLFVTKQKSHMFTVCQATKSVIWRYRTWDFVSVDIGI